MSSEYSSLHCMVLVPAFLPAFLPKAFSPRTRFHRRCADITTHLQLLARILRVRCPLVGLLLRHHQP
jgi:hypothetical protein